MLQVLASVLLSISIGSCDYSLLSDSPVTFSGTAVPLLLAVYRQSVRLVTKRLVARDQGLFFGPDLSLSFLM
jgi:hypothetical protein